MIASESKDHVVGNLAWGTFSVRLGWIEKEILYMQVPLSLHFYYNKCDTHTQEVERKHRHGPKNSLKHRSEMCQLHKACFPRLGLCEYTSSELLSFININTR